MLNVERLRVGATVEVLLIFDVLSSGSTVRWLWLVLVLLWLVLVLLVQYEGGEVERCGGKKDGDTFDLEKEEKGQKRNKGQTKNKRKKEKKREREKALALLTVLHWFGQVLGANTEYIIIPI